MASATTSPEIFWACTALSVGNVGSKFTNKKVIFSRAFFCHRDPRPASFNMYLEFNRKESQDNYLAAFVTSATRDATVKVVKFSLFDTQGETLRTAKLKPIQVFKKGHSWGSYEFFKVTNPGDVVWRIICEVEYHGCPPHKSPILAPTIPDRHQASLGDDYLKLLETGNKSDVTFFVQGEEIKAHRTILLARSSYFSSMFDADMKEGASGEIQVPDVNPVAFRGMLEYIYGGTYPQRLDAIALDLFVVADKYGLEKLREICEKTIIANLNADSVVDALLLAKRHDREELLSQSKTVFTANIDVVQRSREKREKLEQCPSLLFELLIHVAGQ